MRGPEPHTGRRRKRPQEGDLPGGAKFPPSTTTSTQLLKALKTAANHTAWRNYVNRYRPVVLRYARKLGLSADAAEDAAQLTLIAFSASYAQGKFDRKRGRLRDWLFGIARNQILLVARRRKRREVQIADKSDATGFLAGMEDEHDFEQIWNEEWRDAVIRECLVQIRSEVEPQTMQAFELFVHQEWPAKKVADHIGITANAVFGAKRRVLNRLKELLPRTEEIW